MIAGVWVLALMPVIEVVRVFGWAASVTVPRVFGYRGAVWTLDETFFFWPGVYQPLIFCVGVVLLFSKERGRQRAKLDWTRRWGVLCSYVVLMLSAAQVLYVASLVSVGIGAVFQSMPLKYQPHGTNLFIEMSTGYLRYGAHPSNRTDGVLSGFSAIAILLACVRLFDALCSSGPKQFAKYLLAPLVLFSLIHLGQAVRYCISVSPLTLTEIYHYWVYFWPEMLVGQVVGHPPSVNNSGSVFLAFWMEAGKWCVVFGAAVWLSVAQVAAWWGRREKSARVDN
jgi:hypothetical protein